MQSLSTEEQSQNLPTESWQVRVSNATLSSSIFWNDLGKCPPKQTMSFLRDRSYEIHVVKAKDPLNREPPMITPAFDSAIGRRTKNLPNYEGNTTFRLQMDDNSKKHWKRYMASIQKWQRKKRTQQHPAACGRGTTEFDVHMPWWMYLQRIMRAVLHTAIDIHSWFVGAPFSRCVFR
jgi:hypothetical protein